MRSKPSLFDVARDAKVSHQTVSRVLNNHINVRPETKKRVEESVARLGYKVNVSARALATGKYGAVGLLNLNTSLYGPITMNESIQKSALEQHYKINYLTVNSIDNESVINGIEMLFASGVDGILVAVPRSLKEIDLESLKKYKIPIVIRDHSSVPKEVKLNQRKVSSIATDYLISLGHKRIAFAGGQKKWFDAHERMIAWKTTMKKANLDCDLLFEGDWSATSGYEMAENILAEDKHVSAIYAASDLIGLGVLKYLNDGRFKDVSVISTDAMEESEFYYPSLTTIKYDYGELGRRYFQLLLNLIAKRPMPVYTSSFQIELSIRDSTRKNRV
jgi:DNA-binding LacI/PurR family transcriptional regulator